MADAAPLAPFGWDDRVAALLADGDGVPGRVVRVEKGGAFVRLADGEALAAPSGEAVAVGDWVTVHDDGGTFLVDTVAPRWSALVRQDPDEETAQVLAANVDVVFIVAPLDRLRVNRIERELLLAWESGATPVVVLTKDDLVDDVDRVAGDLAERLRGVDVVATSSVTGDGVDRIAALLRPNRTAVLFGPSGAGKSTLANRLLGDDLFETGAVREADQRGRHTTTRRQLVPIPGGGVLIDTPGLRSLAIWQADEGLSAVFGDVEDIAAGCRFSDCGHRGEPGCAIAAAVADGTLSQARVESYLKLLREIEHLDRRDDWQAQQAQKRRWKAIHKANRNRPPKR